MHSHFRKKGGKMDQSSVSLKTGITSQKQPFLLKSLPGLKGQVVVEALLAFLFVFSFLFLISMFYLQSQKEIQKTRLSSGSSHKKTAPWFNKGDSI